MIKGKGISKGIGFGKVFIFEKRKRKIKKVIVENSENELEKFKTALNKVEKEIEETIQQSSGTEKEIMNAYLMILKDPTLVIETENLIKNLKYNAEYAIEEGFNKIIEMFKKINDEYMAERAKDIIDIKEKLLDKILKDENIKLNKLPQNIIIVAKELTTSETAKLDFKNVSGIITEIGGVNSHTAIMARTHSIPLITEIHNINEIFNNEQYICMNGSTGEIFINPTKEEENNLLEQQKLIEEEKNKLEEYKNKETKTKDGFKVELASNIGIPSDVEKVIESTAEGIGLFRTEFLYMDNEKMPTEEEQFLSYKEVAEKMQGKPVIIRTLDVGGDKEIKYLNLPKEENPFLGFRAIRICLANIEMFKIQLRAILKASAYGNISIMIPMISSIEELRKTKQIVEECKKELQEKNIKFKKDIKLGIMIEIPSTAIMAEQFAKECDFFSIGTNDLIQYTVAVERGNEKISNLYSKYNPAVIRLIKMAIDGAHKEGIFCGMCGEVAGDSKFIPILIGMGLDEFSMNSNKILQARKVITNLEKKQCEKLVENIIKLDSSNKIKEELENF
mgnify:FL=1